jgi:hypothetical protein
MRDSKIMSQYDGAHSRRRDFSPWSSSTYPHLSGFLLLPALLDPRRLFGLCRGKISAARR